jgi:hypothetical protein
MKRKTALIVAGTILFLAAVTWALLREVNREEAVLAHAISGTVDVAPGVGDLARTDRLVLMLVEPGGSVAAVKYVSPFIPPLAVSIGQADALDGRQLAGQYVLFGVTDKDGEPARPHPGEVVGHSSQSLAIGLEQVRLVLDQPFRIPLSGPLAEAIGGSTSPYNR